MSSIFISAFGNELNPPQRRLNTIFFPAKHAKNAKNTISCKMNLTGFAGTYVAASMLEATRPTSYYAKAS